MLVYRGVKLCLVRVPDCQNMKCWQLSVRPILAVCWMQPPNPRCLSQGSSWRVESCANVCGGMCECLWRNVVTKCLYLECLLAA